MPEPVLLRHPSSLEHDTGAHPESARRIVAIERVLAERDWLGWDVRLSPAASRAAIEAVHPARHVERIEALAARGGGMVDADTVVSAGSFEAALHAAGGAVAIVDALLGSGNGPRVGVGGPRAGADGTGAGAGGLGAGADGVRAGAGGARVAASLHRPPGHHATADRAMGFCLFNNVAIAAQHALDAYGARRVLIVDWDVHHGNGTNDIFAARDDVLFCSIHQSPLYPGSGRASDAGHGPGAGYTVNLPVPGGSGDAVFVSIVEHVVRPLARAYAPDLVLVSAGYDAHADDPLAGCDVTDAGYGALAASARAMAGELGAPLGIVLEGGYDLGALARCVAITLEVVGAERAPAVAEIEPHPLAAAALDRLAAGIWPGLA